jgi:hypothetical protein
MACVRTPAPVHYGTLVPVNGPLATAEGNARPFIASSPEDIDIFACLLGRGLTYRVKVSGSAHREATTGKPGDVAYRKETWDAPTLAYEDISLEPTTLFHVRTGELFALTSEWQFANSCVLPPPRVGATAQVIGTHRTETNTTDTTVDWLEDIRCGLDWDAHATEPLLQWDGSRMVLRAHGDASAGPLIGAYSFVFGSQVVGAMRVTVPLKNGGLHTFSTPLHGNFIDQPNQTLTFGLSMDVEVLTVLPYGLKGGDPGAATTSHRTWNEGGTPARSPNRSLTIP